MQFETKKIYDNKFVIKYINHHKSVKINILVDHSGGKLPNFDNIKHLAHHRFNHGTCNIEDHIHFKDFTGKLTIIIKKMFTYTTKIKMNFKNGKPFGYYPQGAISISSPTSRTIKYFCDEDGMTLLNEPAFVHDKKIYYGFERESIFDRINTIKYISKTDNDISTDLMISEHSENPLYNYVTHRRKINFIYVKHSKNFYKDLTLFSDEDELLLKYFEATLT